ncbi:aminotransferase class I/II-fold pyridoxal phosphate-dependent enzyme [Methylocystis sp.]|uniref:aminotransferase class I/II-fold pyridoxal phosphate-dependent enzyme n=1 Tax=Methylocystis sp. TaxID=1911079 RepID=UPI0011D8705A|nr:aminotransferase class I/II-fold pyridoxal phosphate-dependent enzyme [Methylocystis sp.]KAF0132975.1 MAG: 8-amino-7-oxononanoate synthase [Methylocystaceae bacterium]KAF0214178.1 MAG: 8-amino-7-oxononanoate [Methylocystaceae bacterium]MDP3555187.1 aminotransferase class I/II-fold pyridoxal phosphate-dependent enzyme [Methylocystis sp.]TXT43941.1 MAG: 8-amino-7-oxononanoate synthase [Methylocystaceae bacterium]
MTKHKSLEDYAARRFRFAGNALLEFSDPFFAQIDRLRAEFEAQGKHFVSFANYDYLGLANHPRIREEAKREIDGLGIGALASRLVGGERTTHKPFEAEIAEFLGMESALTLVSGYLSNVTTIAWLMSGKRDAIFIDELAHNSIVAGADGAPAQVEKFRHNDLDHLDHLLARHREEYRNVLIVVEGVYSMDGDTADLPRLLAIKEKYKVWLLVDEAHSLGVLGETGRGLAEHQGVDPARIDLIVGTMSKTLASCGGYVCGKKQVIDWFRYTLPGFVYSVGLSPVILAAARTALRLMQEETWRIAKLADNAELFRTVAHEAGFSTGPAIGRGVVPILFSSDVETMWASQHLLENGYYVPPVVRIGVPKDGPRLRFFFSANHSEAEIRGVIQMLRDMPPVTEEAHQIVAAAMAGG